MQQSANTIVCMHTLPIGQCCACASPKTGTDPSSLFMLDPRPQQAPAAGSTAPARSPAGGGR